MKFKYYFKRDNEKHMYMVSNIGKHFVQMADVTGAFYWQECLTNSQNEEFYYQWFEGLTFDNLESAVVARDMFFKRGPW